MTSEKFQWLQHRRTWAPGAGAAFSWGQILPLQTSCPDPIPEQPDAGDQAAPIPTPSLASGGTPDLAALLLPVGAPWQAALLEALLNLPPDTPARPGRIAGPLAALFRRRRRPRRR